MPEWNRKPGFDLNGKKALVVGFSNPGGRAIALALAEAGADVATASATLDGDEVMEAKRVARDAAAMGRDTFSQGWDVTLPRNVQVGLKHEGWSKDGDKLAGVVTKVIYGDDQQKTDAGVREAEKLLDQEKVNLLAGIVWSNVALAVYPKVIAKGIPYVITNAGASQFAGEMCNPLLTSTSWNNDQVPEALGQRMNQDKIESIYMLAPNYQAGKDMIAGVKRTLKGPKIVGEDYFKLGETDHQASISKARASGAKAVFIFAPGGMGVAFFKNWQAAGAGKDIKLYTAFTVDWSTLPAIGDA
ncbi:MAG: hypothetical protein DYG91_06665, partial [Chloroflexi bacterium CFX7]|nr:hypothetical protein [Chloroflexi bacterium CFX7]